MNIKNIYLIIIIIFFIIFNCETTKNKINNKSENDPRKIEINENIDINQLKNHMKNLFTYIENLIAKADYEKWYESISIKYKKYLNDPINLKIITNSSDYLKNRKIELKDPKDYFEFVVIPSRENGILNFFDCELITKNHVKVICFDKNDKLIYDFIFEENLWRIDR